MVTVEKLLVMALIICFATGALNMVKNTMDEGAQRVSTELMRSINDNLPKKPPTLQPLAQPTPISMAAPCP